MPLAFPPARRAAHHVRFFRSSSMSVQRVGRLLPGALERRGMLMARTRTVAMAPIATGFGPARAFSLWGNSENNEAARRAVLDQVSEAKANSAFGADKFMEEAKQTATSLKENLSSASTSVQDGLSSAGTALQSGWSRANEASSQLATDAKSAASSAQEYLSGANASIEEGLARASEAGSSLASSAKSAASSTQGYLANANASIEHGLARASETGGEIASGAKGYLSSANEAGAELAGEAKHAMGSVQERLSHANHSGEQLLNSEVEAISEASQQATTELTSLGLGGWSPSGLLQHLLDSTQYLTNLPWWATIVLVTCGIRLALAPLLVYVQGNSIRLSNIQPQMQGMLADLEYAKSTGNQQEMQRSAVQVRKLLSDNNCSPFRSLLLPAVQMPVFLSFYFALDGLAKAKLPALTTGGFGWVQDLTLADPYYVLPITSSLMTLLVLETGAETGTTAMNQTSQARLVKNILRGVTVLAAWFVSGFPSAVLLYWTTTNTFSLLQLLALRTRFMKRTLKLPERIEHPVKPNVKQKSFMEGLRSGLASGNAHPGSEAAARRPPPASLYARKVSEADSVTASRGAALDSMLSESGAQKHAAPNAAQEEAAAEKQSRVAAARERRLRKRT